MLALETSPSRSFLRGYGGLNCRLIIHIEWRVKAFKRTTLSDCIIKGVHIALIVFHLIATSSLIFQDFNRPERTYARFFRYYAKKWLNFVYRLQFCVETLIRERHVNSKSLTDICMQWTGVRYSKVPHSFRARKAISKTLKPFQQVLHLNKAYTYAACRIEEPFCFWLWNWAWNVCGVFEKRASDPAGVNSSDPLSTHQKEEYFLFPRDGTPSLPDKGTVRKLRVLQNNHLVWVVSCIQPAL